MEEKRKMMEVEMLKRDADDQLLEPLMVAECSQHRKEIIGDQPNIIELISRWPAMFHERQIRAEFRRIITTDLLESFLDELDGLVPRLLDADKAATKSGKKSLKDILDCLVKDDTNERRQAAALLGLPLYISGEDPSAVIRMCDAHVDTLDDAMKGMQLGLLIACEGGEQGPIPHETFDVAAVVEETIVLHNMKDVAQSFAMLMGVIYCVNPKYPDDMKYSFEFLQRVVMKIRPEQASARVHGLRNRILRYKLYHLYFKFHCHF